MLFTVSPNMRHLTPNLSDFLMFLMLSHVLLAQVRQWPGGPTSSCRRQYLSLASSPAVLLLPLPAGTAPATASRGPRKPRAARREEVSFMVTGGGVWRWSAC